MIPSNLKDRPELDKLVRDSIAKFNSLPMEEQKKHRAAQRKSWVVGETMMENPEMTKAEAEELYERACQ